MDHVHNTNPTLRLFEELISKDEKSWSKRKTNFRSRMEKWLQSEEANRRRSLTGEVPKKNNRPLPPIRQLNRFSSLLRPPTGVCEDWAFNVPRCYNDSLDILYIEKQKVENKKVVKRWMEWSQGTTFSFRQNDVFYDVNVEGVPLWKDCMALIGRCIRVTYASPARIEGDGAKSERHPGSVEFELLVPNEQRDKLVVDRALNTTQDGLVRFLITGDLGLLK